MRKPKISIYEHYHRLLIESGGLNVRFQSRSHSPIQTHIFTHWLQLCCLRLAPTCNNQEQSEVHCLAKGCFDPRAGTAGTKPTIFWSEVGPQWHHSHKNASSDRRGFFFFLIGGWTLEYWEARRERPISFITAPQQKVIRQLTKLTMTARYTLPSRPCINSEKYFINCNNIPHFSIFCN